MNNGSPKRVLIICDGGNAPGYMSIMTSLTEEGLRRGFEVHVASEGFRSLTRDRLTEHPWIRLVWDEDDVFRLRHSTTDPEPILAMSRRINTAGCNFRSERYKGFSADDRVDEAAKLVQENGFDFLVGVGGNGTFRGIRCLSGKLPRRCRSGFINCSIDSDLLGDRSIGFHTGVQEGAKIARGLFDDAFTHKRLYLLEMMGNRSGKHALHAGASSRAHLIVLPQFTFTDAVLEAMATKLQNQAFALVVVAEGYGEEARSQLTPFPNAAEYFKGQLSQFGLQDKPGRRVIAEPFGRYLRGVVPTASDIELAVLKSYILMEGLAHGADQVMAYFLSEHNYGLKPFAELETDNSIEPVFYDLIDRIGIPELKQYVAESFRGYCPWPPPSNRG